MVCIYCSEDTKVINSRLQKRANTVWRRRKCINCAALVTSLEKVDLAGSLIVIKKNGLLEPFYEEKLLASLLKCLDHRPNYQVKAKQLNNTVVSDIIHSIGQARLSTKEISDAVTIVLKNYDLAALVKYTSYQRQLSAKRDINRLTKN